MWLKRFLFFLVTNKDALLLVEDRVVWLHLSIEDATPAPGCCRDGGQLFSFQDLLPTIWATLVLGKHCWCLRGDEGLAHHSWEEFWKFSKRRCLREGHRNNLCSPGISFELSPRLSQCFNTLLIPSSLPAWAPKWFCLDFSLEKGRNKNHCQGKMKSNESETNRRSQWRNCLIPDGNGHNPATGRDKTTGGYSRMTPDQAE